MRIKILNHRAMEPDDLGCLPIPYYVRGTPNTVMPPKMIRSVMTLSRDEKSIVMLTREPFYTHKELEHRVLNEGKTEEYFNELVKGFELKPLVPVVFYASIDGYYRGTSSNDMRTIGFQPVVGYEPPPPRDKSIDAPASMSGMFRNY